MDRDIFSIMRFKIIRSKQFVTLHYDTLRYIQGDAVVHDICIFFFNEHLSHCNFLQGCLLSAALRILTKN